MCRASPFHTTLPQRLLQVDPVEATQHQKRETVFHFVGALMVCSPNI